MQAGSSILVAAVVGALGGFCGGLATGWVRPRAPEVKAAPTGVAALTEEVRELSAQVTALEAEVNRVKQQRRVGSASAPAVAAGAAAAAPAETARAHAPDDPVFEAAVRDVLDRVQQERAGERDERRAQATQRWADRFAEKAQLTEQQKASALAIAEEISQKMRDLRDGDAGALSGEGWFEQRNALRAQGEQKLAEVLTPRQMTLYRESSDLRLDAAFRGGGRGRGGP